MTFRPSALLLVLPMLGSFSLSLQAQPSAVSSGTSASLEASASARYLVRFRIEAPGAPRMFLAGSFNDWNKSALEMKLENGAFVATVPLPPGEHQYKFVVNGSEWKSDPANPASVDDGLGGENSVIRVGADGSVSMASAKDSLFPPSLRVEALGGGKSRVTFIHRAPGADKVYLAGSFNGWSPARDEMVRSGDEFTTTVLLEDGEYHYKFVVNGTEWRQDPLNPEGTDDNNQGQNSVLRLGPAAHVRKSSEKAGDGRILESGLHHNPGTIEFFNPLGDGRAVVKLRTMAGDVTSASVRSGAGTPRSMRSEYRDDRFETFSAHIPVEKNGDGVAARYLFHVADLSGDNKAPVQVTLCRDGVTTSAADARVFDAQRRKEDIFLIPAWARDVVWYEIFPERFRNGSKENDPETTAMRSWTSDWFRRSPDETGPAMEPGVFGRRYGGDLQGVVEKLPYLKELGVGAIWFNPVFEAESLHKYDATDYRHIDDNFGFAGEYQKVATGEDLLDPKTWKWSKSDQLFLDFVKQAHGAGMKVIVDGVFNHTGTEHPAFQDLLKNKEKSRFRDWYNVSSWQPFQYEGWGGYGNLPVFREGEHGFAAESLKQHLRDVTRRWMDPNGDGDPSDGIDGWRLDVPNEVSSEWWREWRDLVKSINPDAIIIGEIWDPPAKWLKGDQFDSVMNYQMAQALSRFITNSGPATGLRDDFAKMLHSVPEQANRVMMNLMNSHDTDRLVSQIFNPGRGYDARNRQQDLKPGEYKSDKPSPETYRKMKQLTGLQFAYPGSPMIYYGDEAGMWGADDPEDRKPMIWKDLEPYEKPEENHFMADVHAHFQRLAAIRNSVRVLADGGYETLLADDAARTFAFRRFNDRETAVVVTNDSGEPREVRVPLSADAPRAYVELVGDPAVKVVPGKMDRNSRTRVEINSGAKPLEVRDGVLTVSLQPHTTAILVSR